MPEKLNCSIIENFRILPDPRREHNRKHNLIDIIVIAICGMICGADEWVSIENFGNSKIEWFKRFLELPNGIPSHDTFGRVFSIISPKIFQECFISWIQSVCKVTKNEIIPIDGKTLRRSHDKRNGKSAIHMVSAWSSRNGIVLGQCKTSEKSNEITAIPELLKALEIKGCIVTIDAMGCQKKIAKGIIKKKADYVFGLKGNQSHLQEEVKEIFSNANKRNFKNFSVDYLETSEKGHGRIEQRKYWVMDKIDTMLNQIDEWEGFRTIGMVESDCTRNGRRTVEYRYYISSMKKNAKRFSRCVREHWHIENSLHWILDIAFREDDSRVRKGYSAENLSMIRHIALNLLKKETTAKVGVKNKRLKAGWDDGYLIKVLSGLDL